MVCICEHHLPSRIELTEPSLTVSNVLANFDPAPDVRSATSHPGQQLCSIIVIGGKDSATIFGHLARMSHHEIHESHENSRKQFFKGDEQEETEVTEKEPF